MGKEKHNVLFIRDGSFSILRRERNCWGNSLASLADQKRGGGEVSAIFRRMNTQLPVDSVNGYFLLIHRGENGEFRKIS